MTRRGGSNLAYCLGVRVWYGESGPLQKAHSLSPDLSCKNVGSFALIALQKTTIRNKEVYCEGADVYEC
jgi:hypothetical protein